MMKNKKFYHVKIKTNQKGINANHANL